VYPARDAAAGKRGLPQSLTPYGQRTTAHPSTIRTRIRYVKPLFLVISAPWLISTASAGVTAFFHTRPARRWCCRPCTGKIIEWRACSPRRLLQRCYWPGRTPTGPSRALRRRCCSCLGGAAPAATARSCTVSHSLASINAGLPPVLLGCHSVTAMAIRGQPSACPCSLSSGSFSYGPRSPMPWSQAGQCERLGQPG
jgi:hypothetical protein